MHHMQKSYWKKICAKMVFYFEFEKLPGSHG